MDYALEREQHLNLRHQSVGVVQPPERNRG